YIAPEVFQGEPSTEASDLYAVGMIAYELLTGHHPFDVDNITNLTNDILYTIPTLSTEDISRPIATIVERLLAKSPADRYSDAGQVIAALSEVTNTPLGVETAAIRESFLQAARLVERDQQVSKLAEVLDMAY